MTSIINASELFENKKKANQLAEHMTKYIETVGDDTLYDIIEDLATVGRSDRSLSTSQRHIIREVDKMTSREIRTIQALEDICKVLESHLDTSWTGMSTESKYEDLNARACNSLRSIRDVLSTYDD